MSIKNSFLDITNSAFRVFLFWFSIYGIYAIILSHNWDMRISLFSFESPEAYKVIGYTIIYLVVYLPKFKNYSQFAFIFWYFLSENFGNYIYWIYHIAQQTIMNTTPYAVTFFLHPTDSFFYLRMIIVFPIGCFISWLIIRPHFEKVFWSKPLKKFPLLSKQRLVSFAILSWILVIIGMSFTGYHLQSDACCSPLANSYPQTDWELFNDVWWYITWVFIVITITLNLDGKKYESD